MRAASASVTRFLSAALCVALLSACASSRPGPVGSAGGGTPAPQRQAAQTEVDLTAPVPVALLLPQTGPQSGQQAQARDMEAAASMAARASGNAVALRIYDTGADPAAAAAAARRAADEGAALIIGPVFARTTDAVRPVAAATGLRAIALTPYSGSGGDGVYVMGFAPDNEVDRIIGYAASQGYRRIALLTPRADQTTNLLSDVVADAARRAAARNGASIVDVIPYLRTNEGIQEGSEDAADRILGSGADAVLLIDRGQGLVFLAAFLNYYDVVPEAVKYLGLAGWSTEATRQEPTLQGGWFAAPDTAAAEAFAARFEAETGRRPSSLAILAHDGVAAAAQMVARARAAGGSVGALGDAAITDPAGFDGAAGRFGFSRSGVVQRELSVFEVAPEGFILRDAAGAAPAS